MNLQVFARAVAIGVFATLMMDIGALLSFRAGLAGRGPRRQGLEFVGRWIGYLIRGHVHHKDILLTPSLPGERKIGLGTHYATGIGLALVYVTLLKATTTVSSLWLGLAYGIFTVILPWFLYFPAIGAGRMGRVASPGMDMARTSFVTHALYGIGLGVGAMIFL